MKVYVLMYDCSHCKGVFSSVEKVIEFIKNQYNTDIKTRIKQHGHYNDVYIEYTYKDVVYECNLYTIIEEELDGTGTEFYGRT